MRYELLVYEIPSVNGYTELMSEVGKIVNDFSEAMKGKIINVQIERIKESNIYTVYVHCLLQT